MKAPWRRARRLSPLAVDRAFALLFFAAAEAEAIAVGAEGRPLAVVMLLACGWTLPFAVRRVNTLAVTLVIVATLATLAVALPDATKYFTPFLAVLILAYSVGAYTEGRRAYVGLALIAALVLFVTATAHKPVVGDYLFPTAFAILLWVAGRAVRTRMRLTEELHEAALQEQEAHEQEVQRAAAEERRRIAREMHDVVAHSVSVMVVQAGGARRILDRDPQRAIAAAEQIERTGREALAEMRRLLGVLHHEEPGEPAGRAPQPSMRGVGELVERARDAGLPVALYEEGERRELPAGLDLAAFRVVQEGLTNALKYSGQAPTSVRVAWTEDALELEIADRGPGPAARSGDAGHGLIGMRERVRLYGGELEAGRRRGGGFRIHAKLPLVPTDEQAKVPA